MRTRKEIEQAANNTAASFYIEKLILEVLLDIRDAITNVKE